MAFTLQEKLLSGQVIVLDGATGTEIARLGGEMHSAAWCAVANKTHPDMVRQIHEDYVQAGADVITTNTFATCRHVLAGAGMADETVAINRRAVELACEARDRVGISRPVAVAGSLSNTLAWQQGTTIPDPRYIPSPAEEADNYREMADTLANAGADFLLLEMMLDVVHASRLMEAAVATGLPVWVGISCSQLTDGTLVGWDINQEGRVRGPRQRNPTAVGSGDDNIAWETPALVEIIQALKSIGGEAFGIMHSTVETTSPGLAALYENWSGPVMAYPETMIFDHDTHRARIKVAEPDFSSACRAWVESGVQIIGGCCGTTIEHIRQMVDHLPTRVGPRTGVIN